MLRRTFLLLLMSLGSMSLAEARTLVYFGSYSQGSDAAIYVADFDVSTGELGTPRKAARMSEAGFVAFHPNGRQLYAIGEREKGVVRAFEIDRRTGLLKTLNDRSSGGPGPCHVALNTLGTFLFTANYSGGSVAAIRIQADGFLAERTARIAYEGSGAHPTRQERPHAHSTTLDPSQRYLIAADLGTDRLMIHRFDPASGTLTANDPAFVRLEPGSGPRHFTFHPDGRHAYVLNELTSSVTAFDWDATTGTLTPIQTISMLPPGFTDENTGAEVVVHASSRFLYASNRGHDSIAIFSIDPVSAKLTAIGHQATGGHTPRNFAIDPTGKWMIVANQKSNNAVVFALDPKTGALQPNGQTVTVSDPTCVRYLTVE